MTDMTRRAFGALAFATTAATLTGASAFAAGHSVEHTVTIQGHSFSPKNLTVNAGDTVTFVNQDGAPHTATANSKAFDTGRLRKGSKATLKFSTAGRYPYFCEFHPGMKGSITVQG
ncbi:cupredoxin domain-containing protein [Algirhabdus cladophorae]|uniref:cupredoxin domain-containing protein n=1 Tax=Algirhabdus cladophorae TaxID=3377108 RepID=UPI003B84906E